MSVRPFESCGPLGRARQALIGLLELVARVLARFRALLRRRVPTLGKLVVHMGEGFLQLIVQGGLFSVCGVSRRSDSFLAALR